jgi:hypothetical protein
MKTGGRVRGTPNRAMVEKRLQTARQLDDARNYAKPLAKDRLDELLRVAFEMMPATKPITPNPAPAGSKELGRCGNVAEFGAWFDRAAYA